MMFTKNANIMIMASVAIIWAFILINIDRMLGFAYLGMVFFYFFMWKAGKVYPIVKGSFDFGRNFSLILIASFFLIFIDSYIANLYSVTEPTIGITLPSGFITPLAQIEMKLSYTVYLFILMIAVPITEEMFFRGALIPFFDSLVHNEILVAITSSGAFGLWHYYAYSIIAASTEMAIASMIMASIFGFVAYYIVRKKGELIHVIFLHGIYNGFIEFKNKWWLNG